MMAPAERQLHGFSPEWVRAAEAATGEALTNGTLMQRAAAAIAEAVDEYAQQTGRRQIAVLVGPGNNGGDALYAARNLAELGYQPVVVLGTTKAHQGGLQVALDAGLVVLGPDTADDNSPTEAVASADIVLDGLLGIGAQPREHTPWEGLLAAIGVSHHVIAIDCPTPGVRADLTVTFGVRKTSHLLDPAAVGELRIVDIGLGVAPLGEAESVVLSRRFLSWQWPIPGRYDHKYTRGVVGLATGSDAYPGAAVLGATAAVTAGAGMVRYLGPARPSDAVLTAVPEAVFGDGRVQCWVVGSGVDGVQERQRESDRYQSLLDVLERDVPAVIDAGALAWLEQINRPDGATTVLTPHAGELVTVLAQYGVAVTRQEVDADPVRWARRASRESGFIVMLKGGATVISHSDETPAIIENRAPAWLATAGTGDVLAALVGVALASGIPAARACAIAAYIHGEAARLANPGGPVRALEVARHTGTVIAQLVNEHEAFLAELHAGNEPGAGS